MKQRTAGLFVVAMLPWAGLNAQQAGTTAFRVSVNVVESCGFTVPDAVIGDDARHRASIRLRATCSPDATYSVGLSKRGTPGATLNQRKVLEMVTGVGTGEAVDHALFGGIPAIQAILPVDNADSMLMRVYF